MDTATKAPMRLDLKREHQTYRTKDGKKCPGVTTVLGVYSKEALLPWVGNEERDGILKSMGTLSWTAEDLRDVLPLTKEGRPALFAFSKRDKAADFGTVVHAHIEARCAGTTLSPEGIDPETYAKADIKADQFFYTTDMDRLVLVASELQMVSEEWRCGGTLDTLWRDGDGALVLRDVKTSKPWYKKHPYDMVHPYDEQFAQVAAYAAMYEEVAGEPVRHIIVDRLGKTEGDKGDRYVVDGAQREMGEQLFVNALSAYNLKYELGRHCKERGRS